MSGKIFVPGKGMVDEEPNPDAANFNYPASDMNKEAVEFHPGSGIESSNNTSTKNEELVELPWEGDTYYVPSSMNGVDENGNPLFNGPDYGDLEWKLEHVTAGAPPKRCLHTIGMPESLRSYFSALDNESIRQMPPEDERYKEIPPRYSAALLLDVQSVATSAQSGSMGYPSSLYRATDQYDGQMYVLRRFDNVRSNPSIIKNALDRWASTRHPSIVSLFSITQEKGAIFFTHAYHPGALTLKQRFLDQRGPLLTEALLWRMAVQLLTGIRFAHARGFPLRAISPAHVLLTGGTRFRFNNVGVMDVLEFETRKNPKILMQEDLARLGLLMLSMASRTTVLQINSPSYEMAMNVVKQNFSVDLKSFISQLLSESVNVKDVYRSISDRIIDETDIMFAANDGLHSHLQCEYENGRVLKMLIKLGFLNERPEYHMAPQWGASGDRYILKLFRDFVFHQTLSDGGPVLDAGHIISCLNKLDIGSNERIALCSRDTNDLLIVTYADVQRCVNTSFGELSLQSEKADPVAYQELHQNSQNMRLSQYGYAYDEMSNRSRARERDSQGRYRPERHVDKGLGTRHSRDRDRGQQGGQRGNHDGSYNLRRDNQNAGYGLGGNAGGGGAFNNGGNGHTGGQMMGGMIVGHGQNQGQSQGPGGYGGMNQRSPRGGHNHDQNIRGPNSPNSNNNTNGFAGAFAVPTVNSNSNPRLGPGPSLTGPGMMSIPSHGSMGNLGIPNPPSLSRQDSMGSVGSVGSNNGLGYGGMGGGHYMPPHQHHQQQNMPAFQDMNPGDNPNPNNGQLPNQPPLGFGPDSAAFTNAPAASNRMRQRPPY